MKEIVFIMFLLIMCMFMLNKAYYNSTEDRILKLEKEISETKVNLRILEINLEKHKNWKEIVVTNKAPETKCDFTGEVETTEYIEPWPPEPQTMKPVLRRRK